MGVVKLDERSRSTTCSLPSVWSAVNVTPQYGSGLKLQEIGSLLRTPRIITLHITFRRIDLQLELTGQSVFEFAHPCDHDELRDTLTATSGGDDSPREHVLFLRIKCTLTNRGRNVNLKSATYKVNCLQEISSGNKSP